MKKPLVPFTLLIFIMLSQGTSGQDTAVTSKVTSSLLKADSITQAVVKQYLDRWENLKIGFYVDVYSVLPFNRNISDTGNLIPFSSNCPVYNQIRLNVAGIEVVYKSDKVRGEVVLQFGDQPNLLKVPDQQFIANIRKANLGVRLWKGLWVDVGYMFSPTGYESSWPVSNEISHVTTGGYFEPGSILGVKVYYIFSPKLMVAIYAANPYTLAYGKNTHWSLWTQIKYSPLQNLSLSLATQIGNQALKDADVDNDLFYSNLYVVYYPIHRLQLVGQLDFACQTNSRMTPNDNKTATMFSGFLQAKYTFNRFIAITTRYEFFNDYDGFLSGIYFYDNKIRGLLMNGFSGGIEFKPTQNLYFRSEYRFLAADQSNNVFFSGTYDYLEAVYLTTGLKF